MKLPYRPGPDRPLNLQATAAKQNPTMRPSTQITAAATVLLAAAVGAEATPFAELERAVTVGTLTYKGCYSSSTGLSLNETYTFNTQGWCQIQCVGAANYAVLGLTESTDCWCGNKFPPADTLASDTKCSAPCAGYGQADCM